MERMTEIRFYGVGGEGTYPKGTHLRVENLVSEYDAATHFSMYGPEKSITYDEEPDFSVTLTRRDIKMLINFLTMILDDSLFEEDRGAPPEVNTL
jgi:hypothetical protein